MKTATLVAMSLSAFIVFATHQTQAQETKDKQPAQEESGGHSHFTKIPASVEDIWKEIHKQQKRLIGTVAEKELGEAHDHAFAIRDLVKALPAKVPVEHKPASEAGAKEITKIAADIDRSSAAKAQKATEANVKKMGKAITTLEAKLKSK